MFPSSKYLSELDPNLKSIISLLFININLAPGYLFGPFFTNSLRKSLLCIVTVSGTVIFMAILIGTPTSSTSKLGSGDITVLALKSTLFPIKFPLIIPSFPFILE